MDDPTDIILIDNLKTLIGGDVRPVVAKKSDLEKILASYPDDEEIDRVVSAGKPGKIARLFKNLSLPALIFIPFAIFIALLSTNEDLQHILDVQVGEGLDFDLFLYLVSGWGIWSLIVYEIHGLFFEITSKKE